MLCKKITVLDIDLFIDFFPNQFSGTYVTKSFFHFEYKTELEGKIANAPDLEPEGCEFDPLVGPFVYLWEMNLTSISM